MRFNEGQPEIPDGDVTRFVGKLWEAIPPAKRDSLYEALGDSEMIILRASVPQLVSPEIDRVIERLGQPDRFGFNREQLCSEIEDLEFPDEVTKRIIEARSSQYLPTIHTLGDLISTPREEIDRLRRMGPGRIRQIAIRLNELENSLNLT